MNATQLNEIAQNILEECAVCDAIFYSYSISEHELRYSLQEEFQNFYGFNVQELLTMYDCINNMSFTTYECIEHRLMLLSFLVTCPPEMYPPHVEFDV